LDIAATARVNGCLDQAMAGEKPIHNIPESTAVVMNLGMPDLKIKGRPEVCLRFYIGPFLL
jgi:hypothetical protein